MVMKNDPERVLELTVLMSLFNLHPSHRVMSLRQALVLAFKTKNFILATFIARRFFKLVEDNPGIAAEDVITQAQKILQKSEKTGTNETSQKFEESLFYNENICSLVNPMELKLLVKTQATKQSPLVKLNYPEKYVGKVCVVDDTCEIGKEVLGMKILK